MAANVILKNGIVLQHDAQDNVVALRNTDILIEDDRIVEIGQGLQSENAAVIDCDGKIISLGFINAHHHVWQSQLKGRLGDSTMLDYMREANLQSFNFTPDDFFWGQLAGCLEAIDAGFNLRHQTVDSKAGLSWKEVARELLRSRSEIQERINKVNKDLAKDKLITMMGGWKDILVD
ncbi:hypothetical protein IWW34DRAFT_776179 [Fusarium oxysporum f. sp. albedinis]|uniref:5-methylthioadenosine/S-adenosylhomocysteine deaminase n=1 Tax=Fusarium oxysporum f. sp. raphani TaxID=96318 RepID=A0A8J5NXY8_FUSOX|nr:hypothetical protein FOWG_16882 [Fusarium oxysporum f. sp. lycopersici MN25]KAG7410319.1 5-methylthioadenosine/S-adenosylhomocysteine deaminase [Fusarium oxysporum f. sp. raphani]KAI3567928.1 hypothetical protein IWW34DRAFT_776179 [Fusarium oxysporum f. sp. albedinis]KAK2469527.1 hypothetical protein H9L39_18798 [Fusarium oxysporum f. sp. albedinis]